MVGVAYLFLGAESLEYGEAKEASLPELRKVIQPAGANT